MSEQAPNNLQEGLQSADQLVKAYDFAIGTGADKKGMTPDGLGVNRNQLGTTVGLGVETSNPTSGHRSRVDVNSYELGHGHIQKHVAASEGFASGDTKDLTAKVNYDFDSNVVVDDERNVVDSRVRPVEVNRVAFNSKTNQIEQGTVRQLTEERAERAAEIIQTRAARMIGNEALKRVQAKLESYTPPQQKAA